jgi:hypothetical protein
MKVLLLLAVAQYASGQLFINDANSCVSWTDHESITTKELPQHIWKKNGSMCTADRIRIAVEFADGTQSWAEYTGMANNWESVFPSTAPSSASGWLAQCNVHFLFTDTNARSLPMAWSPCTNQYSGNFDLDTNVAYGSNFRADKSGWNWAKIETCCDPGAAQAPAPAPGADVLLFSFSQKTPGTYSNSYANWWQAGGVVSSGDGKRAAYDNTPISEIVFKIGTGGTARYNLGQCDTMVNIMSKFGLSPASINDNSNTWKTGHGSFPLISTTDSNYFQTQQVTIGQGDGQADAKDWVIFGFDTNPASNWNGDNAIGCESSWNICGAPTSAEIYGKTCGGAPQPPTSPPTYLPSMTPTRGPTMSPTRGPTMSPTRGPTNSPTQTPAPTAAGTPPMGCKNIAKLVKQSNKNPNPLTAQQAYDKCKLYPYCSAKLKKKKTKVKCKKIKCKKCKNQACCVQNSLPCVWNPLAKKPCS